jgi:hypothetical protein
LTSEEYQLSTGKRLRFLKEIIYPGNASLMKTGLAIISVLLKEAPIAVGEAAQLALRDLEGRYA